MNFVCKTQPASFPPEELITLARERSIGTGHPGSWTVSTSRAFCGLRTPCHRQAGGCSSELPMAPVPRAITAPHTRGEAAAASFSNPIISSRTRVSRDAWDTWDAAPALSSPLFSAGTVLVPHGGEKRAPHLCPAMPRTQTLPRCLDVIPSSSPFRALRFLVQLLLGSTL